MKSLVALQSEIESLQKQAAEIRSKEYRKTVADIVATMRAFGITLEELRKASGKKSAGRPKAVRPVAKPGRKPKVVKPASPAKARKPVPVKFRGPNGETWTGRGKQPTWLKTLVDAGRKADEFKI